VHIGLPKGFEYTIAEAGRGWANASGARLRSKNRTPISLSCI
jgi:hypothetical protein